MNTDILVVGYPRTAERFLSHNYGHLTNTKTTLSHNMADLLLSDVQVVTIIRDPLDTISSAVSMGLWQWENSVKNLSKKSIEQAVADYSTFYSTALSLDDIIFIKFEDITNNVLGIVKFLADKSGKKVINNNIFSQEDIANLDKGTKTYLPTSKVVDGYEKVRELVNRNDLSTCYEKYYQCLDRCIIVSGE